MKDQVAVKGALGSGAWAAKHEKLRLDNWIREGGRGALVIRIGFGGILYYKYNEELPKPYSNY